MGDGSGADPFLNSPILNTNLLFPEQPPHMPPHVSSHMPSCAATSGRHKRRQSEYRFGTRSGFKTDIWFFVAARHPHSAAGFAVRWMSFNIILTEANKARQPHCVGYHEIADLQSGNMFAMLNQAQQEAGQCRKR